MESKLLKLSLYYIVFLCICLGNNSVNASSKLTAINDIAYEIIAYDTVYEDESLYDSIIYEYDIIYIAPDTIKLVDTVVQFTEPLPQIIPSKKINGIEGGNIIDEKEIKELDAASEPLQLSEQNYNHIYQWELGVYITPYISGMFKQESPFDSTSTIRSINHKTDLSWYYHGGNGITSISLGYESINEQLLYKDSYFTNTPDISGVYDSLLIKSNWKINNFYDYFNLSFGLGKEWGKNKLVVLSHAYFTIGFLTGNNTFLSDDARAKADLQSMSVNETLFSVSLQQGIVYKISPKIHWHLYPYYRFKIYGAEIHPAENRHTIGISSGFSYFFIKN